MNLPNKITVFRILTIPVFLVLYLMPGIPYGNYLALVVFCIACASDALDGYIARKNNLITNFGKFMDPLADKLLVCSALICFVDLGLVPGPIVIVIIAREFAISGFRLVASDNGKVLAASYWGKIKTVIQMFACISIILNCQKEPFIIISDILLYAALILTVVSLFDYIIKNYKILSDH